MYCTVLYCNSTIILLSVVIYMTVLSDVLSYCLFVDTFYGVLDSSFTHLLTFFSYLIFYYSISLFWFNFFLRHFTPSFSHSLSLSISLSLFPSLSLSLSSSLFPSFSLSLFLHHSLSLSLFCHRTVWGARVKFSNSCWEHKRYIIKINVDLPSRWFSRIETKCLRTHWWLM